MVTFWLIVFQYSINLKLASDVVSFSCLYLFLPPVPNSQPKSVLSQRLIQVTICTEFVWFRANSVIHSELSSDSEDYWILFLNFALIQKSLHSWFWNPSESVLKLESFLKSFWIGTKTWNFSEILLNQYWNLKFLWDYSESVLIVTDFRYGFC